MAQLSVFQGVTELDVIIPEKDIGEFVAAYPQPNLVGIEAAWIKEAPRGSAVPVTFPRFSAMSGGLGTAKAETDEFPERNIALTESQISPSLYGFTLKKSDEASAAAPGIRAAELVEAIKYHYTAMSAGALATLANLAASAGLDSDTYDLPRYRADRAAYDLLDIDDLGTPIVVLSAGMFQNLSDSVFSSSATFAKEPEDTLSIGRTGAYKGNLLGMDIYRSSQLAVSGTGRVGGMFPVGDEVSPIGLAVKEMPRVEMTRGDEMSRRAATQSVCRSWWGAGTTNDRNGLALVGPA